MADAAGPSGGDLISALKRAGVRHIAALPDLTTSAGLLWPLSEDPDMTLIRISREDEGVSICAALSYCDKRAVLLMQQTGLMDSLNNIRAVACEYEQRVCMLVGLLGKKPDKASSHALGFAIGLPE